MALEQKVDPNLKNRGYKTINIKKVVWDRLMIKKIEYNENSLQDTISRAIDALEILEAINEKEG